MSKDSGFDAPARYISPSISDEEFDKLIEPGARSAYGREGKATISMAISLKRIADKLAERQE